MTTAEDAVAVPGTVALVEPVGADVFLNVVLAAGGNCRVRVTASSEVAEDTPIHLRFPRRPHLFDDAGTRLAPAVQIMN